MSRLYHYTNYGVNREKELVAEDDEQEYVPLAPQCFCYKTCEIWTAWKVTNPERRFFGCKKYDDGGCKFFEWIDPPMPERARIVINSLNKEKKNLWRENNRLKQGKIYDTDIVAELNELKEEVMKIGMLKNNLEDDFDAILKKKNMYKFGFCLSMALLGFWYKD